MQELICELRDFAAARDWNKYHTPKNLAIGLSVEASELLEVFTWLSESESTSLTERQLNKVREEVGDIVIYLCNFCDKVGLDPIACAKEKIRINASKYPVEKAYGSAKKYNED